MGRQAPLIEVAGARFAYPDGRVALDGLDLEIRRGEFVGLIGANGSGKSTLAKLLNGLLLPQAGTVRVAGCDTADPQTSWEVRRRVGLVFQNPDNQLVAAVAADDVAFGPENLGLPKAEIRVRVAEALAAVGLEGLADRPPHELSGGQKQRLAIAGVLAMRPDVLVLDEATSQLDPIGRREVVAVVERLRRETRATVVMITHHMEEAALADRLLVLAAGRVGLDGPPREVFGRRELAELGLMPPVAFQLSRMLREAGLPVEAALTVEGLAEQVAALA